MAEALALRTQFQDPDAVQTLRTGAPAVGKLAVTGRGVPIEVEEPESISELWHSARRRNTALLGKLHNDPHAEKLLDAAKADASLGRMTEPRRLARRDLEKHLLCRRFSRVQGVKTDGSIKVRAVDDLTASGANPCCAPGERLSNDKLDLLVTLILQFMSCVGVPPALWKADIDAAYRRIPILPEHRWLLWVAILFTGQVYVAGHNVAPFGSVAAVHAWDRIGALLHHVAVTLLHMPVCRYVDDLFAPDRAECVDHGMACFARITRCLLGFTSVAQEKLQHGSTLVVLGVAVSIDVNGITLWPDETKRAKWGQQLVSALHENRLSQGDASKLAGRLSFAAQNIFRRLGRAMIRPIYRQQYRPLREGRLSQDLTLALQWWKTVLENRITETIAWNHKPRRVVDLFCDARGWPPSVAAVTVEKGHLQYTA